MDLVSCIAKYFQGMTDGNHPRIDLPNGYKAWAFFEDGNVGVFVPYEGETINEEFANFTLCSKTEYFDVAVTNGLALSCSSRCSLGEFASVCANFVEPGPNGEYRKNLIENPLSWWTRWKQLVGNSVHNMMPHSVIGEMVAYYYLLRQGHQVNWRGPERGTHDLTMPSMEYEVKSTISKTKYEINASNPYQFAPSETPLSLFYCVFEESDNGVSINDMERKLLALGADADKISKNLSSLGYKNGRSARNIKYHLYDFRLYEVDDKFPYIDVEKIAKETDGRIKDIEYTIDLAGLGYKDLNNEIPF